MTYEEQLAWWKHRAVAALVAVESIAMEVRWIRHALEYQNSIMRDRG